MPTKLKSKTKSKTQVKPKAKAVGRNPVKAAETAEAIKFAKRKEGVTKRQLAEAMRIPESRANTILTRIPKIKAVPLGPDAGKSCRTLVFSLKTAKK